MGTRLLAIEVGAGTAIPTARYYGEYQGRALIRINPRESAVRGPCQVGLPLGAQAGLAALRDVLAGRGFFSA